MTKASTGRCVLTIGYDQSFALSVADAAAVFAILDKAEHVRSTYGLPEGDVRSHRIDSHQSSRVGIEQLTGEPVTVAEWRNIKAREEARQKAEADAEAATKALADNG